MKKSNKKRRVRFLTLWSALIVIAASVFTGCPQKPKPKPTPKFKVNFSVEGGNGTLTAKLDGKTITGGTEAEKDKTVVFTATPASGYKVKSWTLDGAGVNGTETAYSLKVTKAVTVKVIFKAKPPEAVAYKIEHYKQNVTGTDYTKAEEETKYGKPNEQTQAQAKVYEGFTAKPITQETIKADGSTVVRIDYDRNEITLTFNLDGGTTSSPLIDGNKLKGRFGSDVSVEDPTKPDHAFTGWNPPLPPTFPANDGTHTAQWAALHQITFGVTGANGNISAQLDGSGLTSGNTVQEGKTVVFTATPDAQFAVEQWTVDGNPVPGNTANTYSHTVTAQADIGVKFKYAGPGLVLNTKDFTGEQGKTIIYKLVTSGSKNYTAEPETPGFFTLNTADLNSHGNITISCTAAGASKIRVTDTLSGQSALSGLITVTPVLPDYFAEGGVRYQVTDKENLYVSVTSNTSSGNIPYTGTSLTVPAKVTHDTVEYTVTGIEYTHSWGNTLQSVTVATENEYLSSLDGVIFNKDKTKLLYYPAGKPDTQYTVPAGVTHLGEQAIMYVNALQKLVLPEGLTGIDDYGVFICPNLADINIPSTLHSIGQRVFTGLPIASISFPEGFTYVDISVFSDCRNLTTVELPSSITRIESEAFGNCPALTTVTCKAVTPPSIYYSDVFGGTTPIASATLKVPAGSVEAYQAAYIWKDFGNIVEITP